MPSATRQAIYLLPALVCSISQSAKEANGQLSQKRRWAWSENDRKRREQPECYCLLRRARANSHLAALDYARMPAEFPVRLEMRDAVSEIMSTRKRIILSKIRCMAGLPNFILLPNRALYSTNISCYPACHDGAIGRMRSTRPMMFSAGARQCRTPTYLPQPLDIRWPMPYRARRALSPSVTEMLAACSPDCGTNLRLHDSAIEEFPDISPVLRVAQGRRRFRNHVRLTSFFWCFVVSRSKYSRAVQRCGFGPRRNMTSGRKLPAGQIFAPVLRESRRALYRRIDRAIAELVSLATESHIGTYGKRVARARRLSRCPAFDESTSLPN